MPILAVIFDIGGVLLEVREEDTPRQWAQACGVGVEEILRACSGDTRYRRLETDEITFEQYYEHIIARIGRPMSYEQFTRGWCNIFGGALPGVDALLAKLAGGPRLVCLSNTNVMHTNTWRPRFAELLAPFERVFVSHEMGARKPDAACYQQVLDYLDVPPEATVFIDDKPTNVRAAESLGIRGIVAVDAEQIAADLERLGAIPTDKGTTP